MEAPRSEGVRTTRPNTSRPPADHAFPTNQTSTIQQPGDPPPGYDPRAHPLHDKHTASMAPTFTDDSAGDNQEPATSPSNPQSSTSPAWQAGPLPLEPMDPQVRDIQPGSGVVMRIELAWGKLRRAFLRTCFPGYVRRMTEVRQGEQGGCPFDPVDARDVKFYQNQATYHWAPEHDLYRWRDRLPFVRVGLAELLLLGGLSLLITIALAWWFWPLAIPMAFVTASIIWFFRDPNRVIPAGPGEVVSPADGKIVAIEPIDDPLIGPAYEIGIFLSIFNVHANRAPVAGRVVGIEYRPGKMLNALRPESAKENERLEVRLQESVAPYRVMRVRQITGQFARRIVCWVRPGNELGRGEMFGMIKLGSRTELVLPRTPELEIICQLGQKVAAGSSLIARYTASTKNSDSPANSSASEAPGTSKPGTSTPGTSHNHEEANG